MESGIEHAYHGGVGHNGLTGAHAHEVGGIVQRSQRSKNLHLLYKLISYYDGLIELFAAMNKAMADGVYLVHALHNAYLRIYQRIKHHADSVGMILHVLLELELTLALGLIGKHGAIYAYALAKALGDDFAAVNIDKLIFEGRAPSVYNKNFHFNTYPLLFDSLSLHGGYGYYGHYILYAAAA